MSLKKEIKMLVKEAEDFGFEVTTRPGGHLKFALAGQQPIFGASTPSDHRSILNLRAHLRRAGLPRAS